MQKIDQSQSTEITAEIAKLVADKAHFSRLQKDIEKRIAEVDRKIKEFCAPGEKPYTRNGKPVFTLKEYTSRTLDKIKLKKADAEVFNRLFDEKGKYRDFCAKDTKTLRLTLKPDAQKLNDD